ncbi:MAG TPA: YkvA family protein [Frankiaceae bacterium]|nr:YkvA family protein [Frankiaceae bacterium]
MAVDKQRVVAVAREVAQFIPDVARLFRDVSRDPRVPKRVKYEVGAAAAYLVLPIDVIPDFIPGLGQLDDVAIIGWAVRRLLMGAGENILKEHWHGSDQGLELLLQAASAGLRPKRLLGVLAFGAATMGRTPPDNDDDVIDGEVLSET